MLELNKIHNEDHLATLGRMGDGSIHLIVTSPPYDDMDDDFNPIPKEGMRTYNGYTWDFKSLAGEMLRVLAPGGVLVWVVNDPTVNGSESLASSLQKIYFRRVGFSIHDSMIYEKNGPAYPSQDKYYQVFEHMFVLVKGTKGPRVFNPLKDRRNRWDGQKWGAKRTRRTKDGELTRSDWRPTESAQWGTRFNIWRYFTGAGYSTQDEIAYKHPATFPELLAGDHIQSWTNPGDVVYDPFMGSGTTAKMCHILGRQWVGSEISEEYVAIAEERLQPYLNQKLLF